MKKKSLVISALVVFSIWGAKTLGNHNIAIKNNVLLTNNSNVSISYGVNNLSDISSANPMNFDNPETGPKGILERMPTTDINTKYGEMEITQEGNGYQCKNLSNSNAPVLDVAAVNNIYKVNGQADLNEFLSPQIVNNSGNPVAGQIILPNVNTASPNFGSKYVEAIGSGGAVTIAPFIYNTIEFKNSITVNSLSDANSLTMNDVLEGGGSNDLRFYIGNYNEGSNVITVGVSRGMASVQQEIALNKAGLKTSSQGATAKTKVNNNLNLSQGTANVPLMIKILINKFTYIIIGAILIIIIACFCF